VTETAAGTCEFDRAWIGDGTPFIPDGIACNEPSAALVTLVCVHEHADTPRACYGCAAEVQRAAGNLLCPRCWASPGGRHDCPVAIRIAWDDGTVTDMTGARSPSAGPAQEREDGDHA
jgi:hypothetical protein